MTRQCSLFSVILMLWNVSFYEPIKKGKTQKGTEKKTQKLKEKMDLYVQLCWRLWRRGGLMVSAEEKHFIFLCFMLEKLG